MQILITK